MFLNLLAILISSTSFASNICRDHGMKHALFSIKSDGTDLKILREIKYPTPPNKLRVSPNGKRVAFARCVKDIGDDCDCGGAEYGNKEMVLSDFNGNNEIVVSKASGGFNEYPSWLADGSGFIFMHSKTMSPIDVDLYKYNLKTSTIENITNTQDLLESDNFVSPDGTITVVAQKIVDGVAQKFNNLYELNINRPQNATQLTKFNTFYGKHCCVADAKYSPNRKYLSYSKLQEGTAENWRIFISENGIETLLTDNSYVNQWPMWNTNSSQLLWISWNPTQKIWSIFVKKMNSKDKPETEIRLIGPKLEFKIGSKKLLFGRVGWPDWQHPNNSRIIFSATYLEWSPKDTRFSFVH